MTHTALGCLPRAVGRAMTDGLGAMVLASGEGRRLRPR